MIEAPGLKVRSLNALAEKIHMDVSKNGFDAPTERAFEGVPEDVGLTLEKLALVHSEISEAVEVIRKPQDVESTREHFAEELADAIIRILHLCAAMDIDIEEALVTKIAKNQMRPYKHGKRA